MHLIANRLSYSDTPNMPKSIVATCVLCKSNIDPHPTWGASWNHHRTAAVSAGPAAAQCGCAKSLNDSKTRGLAVALRLVLRTQPRSVSARFWWWFQDAPPDLAHLEIAPRTADGPRPQ